MKWIEMIRVRSGSEVLEAIHENTNRLIGEIRKTSGATDILILQHALYEGDMSVILVWDNDLTPSRTHEGLIISENLKYHGVIDHAVWFAAPGFESCMDTNMVHKPIRKGDH